MIYRVYSEKKPAHAVEALALQNEFTNVLGVKAIQGLRVLNRYDVQGLTDAEFAQAVQTVLSEPQLDDTHADLPELAADEWALGVEYLPGQFDQRADSAAQCIQFMKGGERPLVKSARVYLIKGELSEDDRQKIKAALINPVEAQEASLQMPTSLTMEFDIPTTVETVSGFCALDEAALERFVADYGLAMDASDIAFCQDYFKNEEKRDPTITEIRMIDTYWSDHCRHTTFLTQIDDAVLTHPGVAASFEEYKALRAELGREEKPMTLMDIATIGARALKARGLLRDLDESEEINACSVRVTIDVDGKPENWLLQFKNETHNHPTEIEPFGGAATCLGGAIRDPLSGRSYVYQAMRVTGAGDPTKPVERTLKGKLPQRKIVQTAAAGYSSYGNQIGLATGHVAEIYHPGYVAKRMEIGAVVGACPADHVRRETPRPGDQVILLGGRTGRDGIGGATGSSKSHTVQSLETAGAEVQKGNPPEERKLQRLMRDPKVAGMILRCNDFGAGGISVAVGELADGLKIDLGRVPKKYEGLDGTEIAISESQERMAVVIDPKDVDAFIQAANKENLEATVVAEVTEEKRLTMVWNGETILDISREFLNSNGAAKHTTVQVETGRPPLEPALHADWREHALELFGDLNIASQKGLVERFDGSIGAASVLMPFGGKYQLTPAQAMAAKLPVLHGETDDCSLMAWGFEPYLSSSDPYAGAMLAVIQSVLKVVAAGGSLQKCWLTFQEYFERTKGDPKRWGKPFAALLGALRAQMGLGIGSIGGKDSMSGSFEHIDVPPTLVSFAVSMGKASKVVSTEFKEAGSAIWLLENCQTDLEVLEFGCVRRAITTLEDLIESGQVKAAYVVGKGGVMEAIGKMGFGNRIGVQLTSVLSEATLFNMPVCSVVIETEKGANLNQYEGMRRIGFTQEKYEIAHMGQVLSMEKLQAVFEKKLHGVYPYLSPSSDEAVPVYSFSAPAVAPKVAVAKPKVLIPVFPGTNCEYDTARAFEKAGIEAEILVICNRTPKDIQEAMQAFVSKAATSQIIALPGGFSGGDEPEGSAKFIISFLRNAGCQDAVSDLLQHRDGLMLGICNGFQALVKLGLVPFGEFRQTDESYPTLTFNAIGRHQSSIVKTRIASNKSPWLMLSEVGDVHNVAISHGEGRFVASPELIQQMADNGQIATQYVDLDGVPSMNARFNPNMAVHAIEGIISPDGRVLGKMGHSERSGENIFKNVPGNADQRIFEAAAKYFKG